MRPIVLLGRGFFFLRERFRFAAQLHGGDLAHQAGRHVTVTPERSCSPSLRPNVTEKLVEAPAVVGAVPALKDGEKGIGPEQPSTL